MEVMFLFIETGNKTAGMGNSGPIVLQTGTSLGGTRGKITLSGLSVEATDFGTFEQATGLTGQWWGGDPRRRKLSRRRAR